MNCVEKSDWQTLGRSQFLYKLSSNLAKQGFMQSSRGLVISVSVAASESGGYFQSAAGPSVTQQRVDRHYEFIGQIRRRRTASGRHTCRHRETLPLFPVLSRGPAASLRRGGRLSHRQAAIGQRTILRPQSTLSVRRRARCRDGRSPLKKLVICLKRK